MAFAEVFDRGRDRITRVAAIQLDAQVGRIDDNLAACQSLADDAAQAGAEWIILPEFFTTGMAFLPELAHAGLAPDGVATMLMRELALRHGAYVGGSFLCRDVDGEARNAFFLFDREGSLVGRHDKDLPTMWENCFYTGGSDAGILDAQGANVGVAMCWELIRTQTARRLRQQVDLVVGGSCWWSIPGWKPNSVFAAMERRNADNATQAAANFAKLVGAPVVHAAHCGKIECPMPLLPVGYHGYAEGGAAVFDADGTALAFRERTQGSGFAIADVELGRRVPERELPDGYWICRRGVIPEVAWKYQRLDGRRWYRKQTARQKPAGR